MDCVDRSGILYDLVKRDGLVTSGHGTKLLTKISIFMFLICVDVLDGSMFACRVKFWIGG